MNLKELDSFSISDAISFHDELNSKLWDGQNLRPEVKDQLILIAKDFLEELGVDDLDVQDITVSGSNAAYSYTPHSDLDLHILVDLSKLDNNEIYRELFNAKKTIYNDTHNIKIHGVPVELYVQDAREPVVSLGEYSILKNKWLRIPTKRRANLDQTATKQKYNKLKDIINRTLKSKNIIQVNKILKKIKQYRQAGLDKGGEFGPENLAYKMLRKQGSIEKLYNLRDKLHSETLTIEDYDPNGPPPGPEFKPTMPKGTVRVDVSDVYDWYKLGQHISNMKGLGKHDFGKGPPSTILSFGDEDTEHKYIKDLEKTGLTTTDIDPVDPKQPKGMKRQKVDPTFNVNEAFDKNKVNELIQRIRSGKTIVDLSTEDQQILMSVVDDAKQKLMSMLNSDSKLRIDWPQVKQYIDKYQSQISTASWDAWFKSGTIKQDSKQNKIYLDNDRLVVYPAMYNFLQWRFLITFLTNKINRNSFMKNDVDTLLKLKSVLSEASGYIPSEKEKNDPRFKTALTVDVRPNTMKNDAKKFGNKISRAGIPPTLKASGKF